MLVVLRVLEGRQAGATPEMVKLGPRRINFDASARASSSPAASTFCDCFAKSRISPRLAI